HRVIVPDQPEPLRRRPRTPAAPGTVPGNSLGRFAQRLAAHIRRADLRTRVRAMAGITDASAPLDTQALRRLGTSSYLFLDDISQKARGTSLFAVLPDTNDNSEPRGTDAAGQ
ncbi:hypothetical protein ACWGQ5_50340, partial [Streptomyces sp. NPDC055722]